jgi:hypothetical protein
VSAADESDDDTPGAPAAVKAATQRKLLVKRRSARRMSACRDAPTSRRIEGVLLKQTRRGAWQRRWFSTKGRYLLYQRKEGGEYLGGIDLGLPDANIALVDFTGRDGLQYGGLRVQGLSGDAHSDFAGEARPLQTLALQDVNYAADGGPSSREWYDALVAIQLVLGAAGAGGERGAEPTPPLAAAATAKQAKPAAVKRAKTEGGQTKKVKREKPVKEKKKRKSRNAQAAAKASKKTRKPSPQAADAGVAAAAETAAAAAAADATTRFYANVFGRSIPIRKDAFLKAAKTGGAVSVGALVECAANVEVHVQKPHALAWLRLASGGAFSFIYRYILRESCSQFDSLPLTYLTILQRGGFSQRIRKRGARLWSAMSRGSAASG